MSSVYSAGGKSAEAGAESANTEANKDLSSMARGFANETKGLRQELITQMGDILKTGGSQAQVPMIAKAVEASKQATSKATQGLDAEMARAGLSGTPFGIMMKNNARQSGSLATSQIPTNIAQQILAMIPNFILGQGQTAMGGLGGAASNSTSQANTMTQGLFKSVNLGK